MLTEWQARRLAELAELRHLDGVRRWCGRAAWRRLTRAGDRGDDAAIEVVWELWLRNLDDESWACLDRWWQSALFERVLAALAHPRTSAETRAAIGEFCARHGVAPEDPVGRAVFFVLLADAVDLVDRPVSGMGPGDLATLTAAQRRDVSQATAELLALLRMCLEHRFATDISLGTATAVRAAGDDIALGGAG